MSKRESYEEWEEKFNRSIYVPCHWGNCWHNLDPVTNQILGGGGPITCPCDHVKGWRSKYLEGQARPGVPAKVKGRHGSRVQRSRQRKDLTRGYRKRFGETFGGWLPARCAQ